MNQRKKRKFKEEIKLIKKVPLLRMKSKIKRRAYRLKRRA